MLGGSPVRKVSRAPFRLVPPFACPHPDELVATGRCRRCGTMERIYSNSETLSRDPPLLPLTCREGGHGNTRSRGRPMVPDAETNALRSKEVSIRGGGRRDRGGGGAGNSLRLGTCPPPRSPPSRLRSVGENAVRRSAKCIRNVLLPISRRCIQSATCLTESSRVWPFCRVEEPRANDWG